MRLVELFHARYSLSLRAAKAGCKVRRVALMYLGNPAVPGPGFAAVWIVSRIFPPPHEVSAPGWVTGITVASGAPAKLKVANRNVSPPSFEISIWIKS